MNKNKRTFYAKVLLGCLAGSYLQMFGAVLPVFAQTAESFVVESKVDDNVLTYVSTYNPVLTEGVLPSETVVWAKNCDLKDVDIEFIEEYSLVCESVLAPNVEGKFIADSDGEYYAFVNSTVTDLEGIETKYFTYDLVEYTKPIVVEDPSVSVSISADNGLLNYNANVSNYEGEYELSQTWYEGSIVVGTNETFAPMHDGDYSVNVEVRSLNEEGLVEQEIICSMLSDTYSVVFPVLDEVQLTNLSYAAGARFVLSYTDASEDIVTTTASLDGVELTASNIANLWTLTGGELLYAKDMTLNLTAYNKEGFTDFYTTIISVLPGLINLTNSNLEVTKDGTVADYVEVDSGNLNIIFEAHDSYGNEIFAKDLDRVDVRLNGKLLEGVNLIGKDMYRVERVISVPSTENLGSTITVDVFSTECNGTLGIEPNYCFSKVHKFVVYDKDVGSVGNLVFVKRTNESTVTISGTKSSGDGIKLNSANSDYIVRPNLSTVFSFEMPLAEGANSALIYAAKTVSSELTFYSDSVRITVIKDTTVSPIQWNSPAIVLDGDNQATLHWTDPIYLTQTDYDFSHVNIYRSTVPNFVPSERNLIVQTHNPSWTDTGLDAGTNYYYAIEAVDDLGNTSLLSQVIPTGEILGESASVVLASDSYETQYVGKGSNEEIVDSETGEETENIETEQPVIDEIKDGQEQDEKSGESFGAKLKQFFSRAKDSASTVFSNVTGNIFVQICVGGVLIFVGLMFLISILVWLKEKIVDARLVSLDDDEKDDK